MQTMDLVLTANAVISLETFDFAKIYAQVILNQSDDQLEYYVGQDQLKQQKMKMRLSFQRAQVILFEQEEIEKHYLLYLLSLKLVDQSQIAILIQIYQSLLAPEKISIRSLTGFQEFLLEQQILDPKKLDQTIQDFIQKQCFDLFALEKGFIRVLETTEMDHVDLLKLNISPVRLLIQGIQKNYSKSKLYTLHCHPNVLVQKSAFSLWESDLYEAEKQVLSLANGGLIGEMLAQIQLEARFALGLIYALILLKDLRILEIKQMPQATSLPVQKPVNMSIQPLAFSRHTTPLPKQDSQVYQHTPSIFQPILQPLLTPTPSMDQKSEVQSAELDLKLQKEIADMKVIHQITIGENYFKLLNVPQNSSVELVQKHWSFLKQKLEKYVQITPRLEGMFSKEEIKNLALIIDDAYRILSSDALKSQYIEALKNPPVIEIVQI
jgi:hypothetical protein